MKSKLTLRMDEDVKERAKEVARRRGTSLSALVEDYFRILSGEAALELDDDADAALTPRLKEVHEQIGSPPDEAPFDEPRGDLTEDERAFVKAAAEKHT
jgi:antitoxin component of RelBE/YafQ-DinJ toxin-antitoxin module